MESIQSSSPLRGNVQRRKERRPSAKGKEKMCAAGFITNGFLRSRFHPIVKGKEQLKDWRQKEQDFFSSLQYFRQDKRLELTDYTDKVYPYNIYLAYQEVKVLMQQQRCNDEVIITDNESSTCCITTIKALDTRRTLYYIPFRPLFLLGKDKQKREQYNLLLSVCSYLLSIVEIPSYKHGDYVDWCYDMIEESTVSDPEEWIEEEDFNAALSEIREADHYGKRMHRQLQHPYALQQWENRLTSFTIKDTLDEAIFQLSQEAYSLYLKFPQRAFYDNIEPDLFMPQEEYRTHPDQYVSFTWSERGWLYEQLIEMVNSATQEDTVIEEPLFIRHYDKKKGTAADNLDFEKRLFPLLDNLSDILYTLSDEQHNQPI
jgi:hypothetical protein